ncbi:MAG: hypothetical protein ACFFDH_15510 [Promethearchaeota archaeon]
MKRKRVLIIIFIVCIVLIPIFYNLIVVRSRIYYKIEYNVNLSVREEIIQKIEHFNYTAYLNYYDNSYSNTNLKSYIDADLKQYLKNRIKNDLGFPFSRSSTHNLRYSFLTVNQSTFYLRYNNNRIFSIKDQNNQSFSLRGNFGWDGSSWYLNFTQIPYVNDYDSTLMLKDFILVKINLDYRWMCGYLCDHEYSIEQYMVLDENLDIVLIFVYYYIFID